MVAGVSTFMVSPDDSLLLILRRLDEIERKLDQMLEELRAPTAHRLFGTAWQSSTEGLMLFQSTRANNVSAPLI